MFDARERVWPAPGTPILDDTGFKVGEYGKYGTAVLYDLVPVHPDMEKDLRNAVETREEQESSIGKHIRVPQGQDVRRDEGKVRQRKGRQAGSRCGT